MTRKNRYYTALLFTSFLIVGCSDTTAPVDPLSLREQANHHDAPARTIVHAANAPALETRATSFVATQGEATSFTINYVSGERFMQLEIPADAQLVRPDGTQAADGESIEITVEVHPSLFRADFGFTDRWLTVNKKQRSRSFLRTRIKEETTG